MTQLLWDQVGEREYETGVDHGVLYIPNSEGVYDNGVAWNGLVTVTESPSGAEATPQYADNIKYLNLQSAEEFAATLEAFTYPDEFNQFDGVQALEPGVYVGQQTRKAFGLCYRTKIGNDLTPDAGYKLHLVYGCLAAPSEKAYGTVNDTPEAITFSWELTTTPVEVGEGFRPTAILTIDSTEVDEAGLAALEDLLFGTVGTDPSLPLPAAVAALFSGSLTAVSTSGANSPTYNDTTHVVTLPSVTGLQWKINGVNKTAGAQPALSVGQTAVVTFSLADGYILESGDDNDWVFDY